MSFENNFYGQSVPLVNLIHVFGLKVFCEPKAPFSTLRLFPTKKFFLLEKRFSSLCVTSSGIFWYFKDFTISVPLHIQKTFFLTLSREPTWAVPGLFTLAISKFYGKVRVLFFRATTHFTRQVAHFTRSWSSGKMLAFQPRGFVFEPMINIHDHLYFLH